VRVLVVDPYWQIQQQVVTALRNHVGVVDVLTAGSGERGLHLFRSERPHIVLLGTCLDDRRALALVRELRRIADTPIVLLAHNGSEAEQIEGLRLGADDYITLPVTAQLLVARVDAVLRRGGLGSDDPTQPDFRSGALAMWYARRLVAIAGVPIKLTPLEYQLLYHLARRAGRVVATQVLLDRVWGLEYGGTTKYLKVFVNRLRTKLGRGADVPTIVTERRLGYRLMPAAASSAVGAGPRTPTLGVQEHEEQRSVG
jgi:DNA-binding response OmpR family regulator